MKKLLSIFLLIIFLLSTSLAYAGRVRGYYRSNGTYVRPYYRSNSNYTVRDNYSYYGNYNSYTGGTGSNYYRSSPSSEYYDPFYRARPRSSAGNSWDLFGR